MKPKPNGELKIEKGIEMPRLKAPTSPTTAALRTMEVGESFVVKERIAGFQLYGRFAPKKFTCRAIKGGAFRVWRIA